MPLFNPADYLIRSTEALRPNPPVNRMRYVMKTYKRKPVVVLHTLQVAFWLLGVDIEIPGRVWERLEQGHVGETWTYIEDALAKLPAYSQYDFILPWVAAQINREGDAGYTVASQLASRSTAIAQWALANRVDLGRVPLGEAIREASQFKSAHTPAVSGQLAYRFTDGWTVQRLVTAEQLKFEGVAMQHCVGSYTDRVIREESFIYSLRDPQGQPHVTLEWSARTQRFQQIYGKQNQAPVDKYKPYLWEFIQTKFGGETLGLLLSGYDFKAHGHVPKLRNAELDSVDLREVDLEGADLSGAYLSHANLRGVNLRGANLSGATLEGARLEEANLEGANLSSAHVIDADFENANLRGAKLRFTNLTQTYLECTDLRGADLTGAMVDIDVLNSVIEDSTTIWPENISRGRRRQARRS